MYDPIAYWKQEGKTYYENFQYNFEYEEQEHKLIQYLSKIIKFNSVLEFGCGFGRITRLIKTMFNPKRYVAIDVSIEQLAHLDYFDDVIKIESDIESFETSERFDLVIAVEVLMHQLPSKIQGMIDKMISLSNKHVINLDYYTEGEEKKLAAHNFNHDYFTLYGSNVNKIQIGKQALFHLEK